MILVRVRWQKVLDGRVAKNVFGVEGLKIGRKAKRHLHFATADCSGGSKGAPNVTALSGDFFLNFTVFTLCRKIQKVCAHFTTTRSLGSSSIFFAYFYWGKGITPLLS